MPSVADANELVEAGGRASIYKNDADVGGDGLHPATAPSANYSRTVSERRSHFFDPDDWLFEVPDCERLAGGRSASALMNRHIAGPVFVRGFHPFDTSAGVR